MWCTGLVALQHAGSSQTRDRTHVSCIGRRILNHCVTREAHPHQSSLFLLSLCPGSLTVHFPQEPVARKGHPWQKEEVQGALSPTDVFPSSGGRDALSGLLVAALNTVTGLLHPWASHTATDTHIWIQVTQSILESASFPPTPGVWISSSPKILRKDHSKDSERFIEDV